MVNIKTMPLRIYGHLSTILYFISKPFNPMEKIIKKAIEGGLGIETFIHCACGTEKGNCNERLKQCISLLLSQQSKEWKEKVAKIEGMKYYNPLWEISERDKIRNQAIDDILSILNTPNNE